jgi:hypothetical protein
MTRLTAMSAFALAVAMGPVAWAEVSQQTLDAISIPDKVETAIGTLEFFDGVPTDAAHALQDRIEISAGSDTAFAMPDYDKVSYEASLDPILDLAKGLKRYIDTFGSKDEVDPVHFMIGTASAWGGLPDKDAVYINVQPDLPVWEYELTVKDVPVKGFWSISLYNAKGYFQENDLKAYSLNNLTAKPNSDGSYTIRFGGCGDGVENCLPIMDGWNYAGRMYEPDNPSLTEPGLSPGRRWPAANESD